VFGQGKDFFFSPICNNIFISNIVENVTAKDHKLSLQSVVEHESQTFFYFNQGVKSCRF
jgi:hypothetical protein